MKKFIDSLKPYKKTITAVVGNSIAWGYIVVQSPQLHITASEWLGGAGLLAAAFGVYQITNERVK